MMSEDRDVQFMTRALELARDASLHEDVPVGCVLVANGEIIGEGENRREIDRDQTAHAEIIALRDAAVRRDGWRMDGVTAYVTLEPCVMCAGALLNARVDRVVIGALDENVFGGHANAYTELFAESNVPPSTRKGPVFPMWGEPVAAAAPAPAATWPQSARRSLG